MVHNFIRAHNCDNHYCSCKVLKIKWYTSVVVQADGVSKLGKSTCAKKKNRETSVATSKENGLAVNTVNTKFYIVMCSDQHVGQNHNIE
jgi:hypothetical protein